MAVRKITVKEKEISPFPKESSEFISITDIAKSKDSKRSDYVIQYWMRIRNTIEFIGLWEILHNESFNSIEFDGFRNEAGLNSFSLTPKKWIQSTNAIGIISKSGKYGGTFAHQDIAFEFASWISAEFKLYLLKEFQRLKENEAKTKSLNWNLQRELAKVNYRIHTDAVKEHLIPDKITKEQAEFIYASEADLLNVALFGMTAKQWRSKNKTKEGNLRDYATIEQLVVLSNLESINSVLIEQKLSQKHRLVRLNDTAINQMKSLVNAKTIRKLKK